jgi:hypothetical protein
MLRWNIYFLLHNSYKVDETSQSNQRTVTSNSQNFTTYENDTIYIDALKCPEGIDLIKKENIFDEICVCPGSC